MSIEQTPPPPGVQYQLLSLTVGGLATVKLCKFRIRKKRSHNNCIENVSQRLVYTRMWLNWLSLINRVCWPTAGSMFVGSPLNQRWACFFLDCHTVYCVGVTPPPPPFPTNAFTCYSTLS